MDLMKLDDGGMGKKKPKKRSVDLAGDAFRTGLQGNWPAKPWSGPAIPPVGFGSRRPVGNTPRPSPASQAQGGVARRQPNVVQLGQNAPQLPGLTVPTDPSGQAVLQAGRKAQQGINAQNRAYARNDASRASALALAEGENPYTPVYAVYDEFENGTEGLSRTGGGDLQMRRPQVTGFDEDGNPILGEINDGGARLGNAPTKMAPATTETLGFDRFGNQTGGFAAAREAREARAADNRTFLEKRGESGRQRFVNAAHKRVQRRERMAQRAAGAVMNMENQLAQAAFQGNPAALKMLDMIGNNRREVMMNNMRLMDMQQRGALAKEGIAVDRERIGVQKEAITQQGKIAQDNREDGREQFDRRMEIEEEDAIARRKNLDARTRETEVNTDYVESEMGGGRRDVTERSQRSSEWSGMNSSEASAPIASIASNLRGMDREEQAEYLMEQGLNEDVLSGKFQEAVDNGSEEEIELYSQLLTMVGGDPLSLSSPILEGKKTSEDNWRANVDWLLGGINGRSPNLPDISDRPRRREATQSPLDLRRTPSRYGPTSQF